MASEKFVSGEKIFAYHQNLIYEAKVLKVDIRPEDSQEIYFIHYNGWKDRWNEWVDGTRILKFNPQNQQKAKDLAGDYLKTKQVNKQKKANQGSITQPAKKPRLKKPEGVVFAKEKAKTVPVQIPLPTVFKKRLVEDWKMICNKKYLVRIPESPSISELTKRYLNSKAGEKSENTDVMDGVKTYFNAALGTLLLYRFERPQYSELLKQNSQQQLVDIYGITHLLRLFVKMPYLLAEVTEMSDEAKENIQLSLTEFVRFLEENISWFPSQNYDAATPLYMRMVG